MLQMQPLSGNQRPDLLTALMNMSFASRLPREMHLCRSSSNLPRLSSLLEMLQTLAFCSLLTTCTIPCACHAKWHLNVQKCSVPLSFLHFWLRNVLRATTACTFSTSQLPKMSGAEVLCTFWLGNSLRTTTACTVSTSQLPKVARTWCALYILTSKRALRCNGVQFFISHLARWLCTRRFSKPTFRPSGATNHGKNTVFRDFPTFSRTWIFFLLTRCLSSSLFFSDSSHLCLSSVHIVGGLTSRLPSTSATTLTLLLQLQVQLYDATLHNTSYTALH